MFSRATGAQIFYLSSISQREIIIIKKNPGKSVPAYEPESPISRSSFCAQLCISLENDLQYPSSFVLYTYIYIKESKIFAAYLYLKSRFPLRQSEIVCQSHLKEE